MKIPALNLENVANFLVLENNASTRERQTPTEILTVALLAVGAELVARGTGARVGALRVNTRLLTSAVVHLAFVNVCNMSPQLYVTVLC